MSIEKMRQARESHTTAFLYFISLIKKNRRDLFCCYEGEDAKYYRSRIEKNTSFNYKKIHDIICGSKKEVLKFQDLIDNRKEYSKVKLIYFIDRDFDNKIKLKLRNKIYETPCYSIENFYTSETCMDKILHLEFYLNENDGTNDYKKIIKHFLKLQNQFHKKIKLLNVWIKYQKKNKNRINLNQTKLKNLIKFDWNKIESKYKINDLHRIFTDSKKVTYKELNTILNYFNTKRKCQKFYRGKYEIEFLYFFIEELKKKNREPCSTLSKKRKRVNISLTKCNLLSELSQYADTPKCLKSFLSNVN